MHVFSKPEKKGEGRGRKREATMETMTYVFKYLKVFQYCGPK